METLQGTLLEGRGDLVSRVISKLTIYVLIAPILVLITLLTKSHDPPRNPKP